MAGETSDAPTNEDIEERSLTELVDPRKFGWPTRLGLVGLVLMAVLPLLRGYGVIAPGFGVVRVNGSLLNNITGALFFAVFAMSWDAVSGYTGEISFGHALFFGVGGYTSAILNVQLAMDPLLTVPLGMLAAAGAGLLIGFPSLRLEGPYFSLITLVTPLILIRLFQFAPEVTGGATGLFTDTIAINPAVNYAIAFGVFVLALAVFLAVTRSDAGIVLTAIREDELAVEAAGLNPAKFKLFAFLLSGTVGGLAGALYVHTYLGGFASPSTLLVLTISIEVIIASILGGIGTIVGAAIGGLFLNLFRIYLAQVEATVPGLGVAVGDIYFVLFLVALVLLLFYMPEGVVPRLLAAARTRGGDEGGGGEGGTPDDPDIAADGGRPVSSDDDLGWTDGEPSNLERIVAKFARELRALGGDDGEREP